MVPFISVHIRDPAQCPLSGQPAFCPHVLCLWPHLPYLPPPSLSPHTYSVSYSHLQLLTTVPSSSCWDHHDTSSPGLLTGHVIPVLLSLQVSGLPVLTVPVLFPKQHQMFFTENFLCFSRRVEKVMESVYTWFKKIHVVQLPSLSQKHSFKLDGFPDRPLPAANIPKLFHFPPETLALFLWSISEQLASLPPYQDKTWKHLRLPQSTLIYFCHSLSQPWRYTKITWGTFKQRCSLP